MSYEEAVTAKWHVLTKIIKIFTDTVVENVQIGSMLDKSTFDSQKIIDLSINSINFCGQNVSIKLGDTIDIPDKTNDPNLFLVHKILVKIDFKDEDCHKVAIYFKCYKVYHNFKNPSDKIQTVLA